MNQIFTRWAQEFEDYSIEHTFPEVEDCLESGYFQRHYCRNLKVFTSYLQEWVKQIVEYQMVPQVLIEGPLYELILIGILETWYDMNVFFTVDPNCNEVVRLVRIMSYLDKTFLRWDGSVRLDFANTHPVLMVISNEELGSSTVENLQSQAYSLMNVYMQKSLNT